MYCLLSFLLQVLVLLNVCPLFKALAKLVIHISLSPWILEFVFISTLCNFPNSISSLFFTTDTAFFPFLPVLFFPQMTALGISLFEPDGHRHTVDLIRIQNEDKN